MFLEFHFSSASLEDLLELNQKSSIHEYIKNIYCNEFRKLRIILFLSCYKISPACLHLCFPPDLGLSANQLYTVFTVQNILYSKCFCLTC